MWACSRASEGSWEAVRRVRLEVPSPFCLLGSLKELYFEHNIELRGQDD